MTTTDNGINQPTIRTARQEWMLLSITLVGAGVGQWIWLTQKWPSVTGLGCYIIALTSWLKLTRAVVPRPLSNWKAHLAWIGSAIFGTLALFIGLRGPDQTPLALFLIAIAIAYAALAVSRSKSAAPIRQMNQLWTTATSSNWLNQAIYRTRHELVAWIKTHPIRAILAGGSSLIVVGSGLAAHRGVRPGAHTVSLSAWGIGLALFILAFTPSDLASRLSRWLRGLGSDHRLEIAAVAALGGLAIALRAINLEGIPHILTGDEGAMGLEAAKVLQGQQVNPFSTGWTSHPALYFYNLALFLRLFGQNITALRLASALAGALTVPITYLLARCAFSKTIAGISALFLAGYHVHVHYSRLALNNIWAPLAAALTLLCLWRGLQTRQNWLCALAGIAMGLGQYTYFGARLLPLVVIAWLLYLGFALGSTNPTGSSTDTNQLPLLSGNVWRLVIFWLGFLLTLLPLSWFFLEHWHAFTVRIGQVGVFGSQGVDLAREGYFAPLATGLLKSLMAFNYARDRSIFYGPPLPLLHWLSGMAFVFGTVSAIRWRRTPGCSLLLFWLLGTIIFGGALMNHPPESPRLLFASPATAILVALGLTQWGDSIGRLAKWPNSRARMLALIAAFVATGVSACYYLGIYTPSKQFGDPNTLLAHHLGIWARDLKPDHQVYFFGAPRMTYVGFPSISFLAPHSHIEDVIEPLEQPLPVDSDVTFVFVPQRLDELEIIVAAHPEGRRWEMLDHQGRLLFVAYDLAGDT